MKIIRFILGRIILFLDWITSPRPNPISEEKRNEINSFTSNLVCTSSRHVLFVFGLEDL